MEILGKLKRMAMSQDSHFRITIGMALTILGFVIYAAVYVTGLKNDVSNNTDDIKTTQSNVEVLQNDNVEFKVTIAEINLKLLNLSKGQEDLNSGQEQVIEILLEGK